MAELPRGDLSIKELKIDATLDAKIEQAIKHALEHVLTATLRHELNHVLTLNHKLTLGGKVELDVNVRMNGSLPEPEPEPEILVYDGGFADTTDEEYDVNRDYWLDGGYSDDEERGTVEGGGA